MQYRFPVLAATLLSVWCAPFAHAQSSGESAKFCFTGRPAPQCDWFLVAELDIYQRVSGSTFMDNLPGYLPGATIKSPALHSFWAWSAGAMKSVTQRDAVGAVATYGHANGGRRRALEGRYRRWISLPGGYRVLGSPVALDLSAGVVQAKVGIPRDPDAFGPAHTDGVGLTTGASLGLVDWVALTGRADVVWASGKSDSAVYVGVELGTLPGLLFSAAVLAIIAGTGT